MPMDAWKLAYQVAPLWLTGPPVSNVPGGIQSFLLYSDPALYATLGGNLAILNDIFAALYGAVTSPTSDPNALDNSFGAFNVLPIGTLLKNTVAQYPFANQWVAANAMIREPLTLSLIWDAPMRGSNAWLTKLSRMQQIQLALSAHCNLGGTFSVVTPSCIYYNLLLTNFADASRPNNPTPQNAWRFDFEKPLIAVSDLLAAQSMMISKITKGVVTNGSWSGLGTGIGTVNPIPQFNVQTVPSGVTLVGLANSPIPQ